MEVVLTQDPTSGCHTADRGRILRINPVGLDLDRRRGSGDGDVRGDPLNRSMETPRPADVRLSSPRKRPVKRDRLHPTRWKLGPYERRRRSRPSTPRTPRTGTRKSGHRVVSDEDTGISRRTPRATTPGRGPYESAKSRTALHKAGSRRDARYPAKRRRGTRLVELGVTSRIIPRSTTLTDLGRRRRGQRGDLTTSTSRGEEAGGRARDQEVALSREQTLREEDGQERLQRTLRPQETTSRPRKQTERRGRGAAGRRSPYRGLGRDGRRKAASVRVAART